LIVLYKTPLVGTGFQDMGSIGIQFLLEGEQAEGAAKLFGKFPGIAKLLAELMVDGRGLGTGYGR